MVAPGVLEELLRKHRPDDSFYVFDVSELDKSIEHWNSVFPMIKPYYAVKCNPDPWFIKNLKNRGVGFDCASRQEIISVLQQGVEPKNIIFANPCKTPSDIKFAKISCVKKMTFDSTCELQKIAIGCPDAQLILRIRSDDPDARCNLGVKFGAEEKEWWDLLTVCSRLSLNLIGISFHVGSLSRNPQSYSEGIEKAVKAAKIAKRFNFDIKIIDIGGGFVPGSLPEHITEQIKDLDFEFWAEPGRFFAERVATLMTPVIGVKPNAITISESVYGAFNCKVFDHADPECYFLCDLGKEEKKAIFGSTCDGGDIIKEAVHVPRSVGAGTWVVWPNMGAYTNAATTCFNGIPFNNRIKFYVHGILDDPQTRTRV
jgi:ornithine decarboxylase